MTEWNIAQINVARALHPLDDPRLAEFVSRLDEINGLAECSPGYVWRLKGGEDGELIEVEGDPELIVNMTVWENIEALFDFAYRSAHQPVMANRRQWFERPPEAYQVLWWVPTGHEPTLGEGMDKLEKIRRHGPTREAFSFKKKFPPPTGSRDTGDIEPDKFCVGWD